ncbi:MAG: isochorismatase family cysteine hydrolase [Chloroflexota bacterium]|nr:isochorismatase family cysteine hydrolase [Chloroflexota bacterium]
MGARNIPLVENPQELAERIDLAHCAVLVVDIQNDWCHENGHYAKSGSDVTILQNTVPKIAEFLGEARAYHVPIIHIQTVHSNWTDSPPWHARLKKRNISADALLKPGTWGVEFYKIIPQPDDYVVIKHRYSAFVDTDLDLVLRSAGIKTIIMTGFASNVCVQNTAMHGFMRDYYVALLADCTATFTVEDHEIAMAYMGKLSLSITNAKTLLEAWRLVRKE